VIYLYKVMFSLVAVYEFSRVVNALECERILSRVTQTGECVHREWCCESFFATILFGLSERSRPGFLFVNMLSLSPYSEPYISLRICQTDLCSLLVVIFVALFDHTCADLCNSQSCM